MASGFQTNGGFRIKPGQGFVFADSSKTCCCEGCTCTECTAAGYTRPCCITAVLSGHKCCANYPTPESSSLLNGTYPLSTNTGGSIYDGTTVVDGCISPLACCWGYVPPVTAWCGLISGRPGPNSVSIIVRHTGGGAMVAWIASNLPFLGNSVWFHGTATTTVENACKLTTPVTFTNLITCGVYPYSTGSAFGDGTLTVSAGC